MLNGFRVINTRSREQAPQLTNALLRAGAEVLEIPCLELVPGEDYKVVGQLLSQQPSGSWLVFTSANGIRFSWNALRETHSEADAAACLLNYSIAVIGRATGAALCEYLPSSPLALVSEIQDAEVLAKQLIRQLRSDGANYAGTVLLMRSARADKAVLQQFKRAGINVVDVEVYGSQQPKLTEQELVSFRKYLHGEGSERDCLVFTSSDAVRNFYSLIVSAGVANEIFQQNVVAIGPKTAKTAAELGFSSIVVAESQNIEKVAELCLQIGKSEGS